MRLLAQLALLLAGLSVERCSVDSERLPLPRSAAMLTGAVSGGASDLVAQAVDIAIQGKSFKTIDPYSIAFNALVGAATAGMGSFLTSKCFVAGTQVLMAEDDGIKSVFVAAAGGVYLDGASGSSLYAASPAGGLFFIMVGVAGYLSNRTKSEEERNRAGIERCLCFEPPTDGDNKAKNRAIRGLSRPSALILRQGVGDRQQDAAAASTRTRGTARAILHRSGVRQAMTPRTRRDAHAPARRAADSIALIWLAAWCHRRGLRVRADRAVRQACERSRAAKAGDSWRSTCIAERRALRKSARETECFRWMRAADE